MQGCNRTHTYLQSLLLRICSCLLFSSFGRKLNLKADKLLSHSSDCKLAKKFADYFIEKLQLIDISLQAITVSSSSDVNVNSICHELSEFSPTSVNELSSLVKGMSSKSSILDPIPGSLMKHCFNDLLSVTADTVNLSFDNAKYCAY